MSDRTCSVARRDRLIESRRRAALIGRMFDFKRVRGQVR
jgi:hypothetical protein